VKRGGAATGATPAPAESERTALFVTCADTVFAVASAHVARIVLLDELEVLVPPGNDPPTAGVVLLDGARLPAWDLAALLTGGAEREASAWVVVHQDVDGSRDFALRTGRCACVRKLPARVPLPPSLTRDREGAICGAFRLDAVPELTGHPCGFELAPSALLGDRELAELAELRRRGTIAW
jgi:chemotaxis signal transduction protein